MNISTQRYTAPDFNKYWRTGSKFLRLHGGGFRRRHNRDVFILTFLLLIACILLTENLNVPDHYAYLALFMLSILTYYLFCLSTYRRMRISRVKVYCITLLTGILSVGIITFLVCLGSSMARDLKQNPNPEPFVVKMVNGQTFTNQEFTYIGESSTSLFLYNRQTDESLVFNRQNILSVSKNPLPK